MTIESFPIQTRVFDPDSKLDDDAAAVKLRYEQNADTNGFTDAEKAKLGGVATGATANAPDAELRDRATHTGAQAIGTVTGLQAALDGKAAAAHAHAVGDVAGLQAALDGKAASAHTHPLSALTQSGATTGQVAKWNGSAWAPANDATGGGGVLNNFAATAPPTVTDDSGDGFAVGSEWVIVSGAETWNVYRCKDATVGAAVWHLVFDDASIEDAPDKAAPVSADKVLILDNTTGGAALAPLDFFARRSIEINAQTGTTYSLALTDAGKLVTMANASANTLTIPANATVALPVGVIINVAQKGAGATTITGATGVSVNGVSAGSEAISAQWKTAALVKIAADEWIVDGALA